MSVLSFNAARTLIAILSLGGFGFWATSVSARQAEIYTGTFSSLAVSGYDVVAYFTAGKPTKGHADFQTEWKGALWYFSSKENLERFKENPTAFAPQYGGYCAWAVSQGYTASADPFAWKIVGGKLYLNYDKNVQATWEKNIPGHIETGNRNWPTVLDK